jgi:hypothetical protein
MIIPQARILAVDLDLNPFNPLSESVDSVSLSNLQLVLATPK